METENQEVNPAPVTSPSASQPLSHAPKSKLPLIFGSLLLLLLVGGGAYYLGTQRNSTQQSVTNTTSPTIFQQSNNEISPSTNTNDDLNEWKEYTSKYRYSFKYPSSWGVEDSIGDNGAQIWSKPEYFALSKQQQQGFNKEDYARIEVSSYFNGNDTAFGKVGPNTDLRTFINNRHGNALISLKDTTLDGKPALVATVKREVFKDGIPANSQSCPSPESCTIESGKVKYVWAKVDGDILNINYWYGREYKDFNNLDYIFDNFVSSYKFTN